MGLKIIRQGDGIRPNWYAQYRDGDGWKTINLRVKVHGKPPASLSLADTGDVPFERSRAAAEAKLADFLDQLKRHQTAGGSTPALLEAVEAKKASRLTLAALAAQEELRLRKLADGRADPREDRLLREKIALRRRVYTRFAAFAAAHKPPVLTMRQLTSETVDAYFADLKGCFSRSETGKHLHLIETAWKRYTPTGLKSPFGDIPELLRKLAKDNPAIPRRPLTASEVAAVWKTARSLDAATDSPLKLYPLAVTAACTGLRIADCCKLRWCDLDLTAQPHPLVSVKTAKTGATVTLPIFAELLELLTDLDSRRDCRDEYVFPDAAAQAERDIGVIVKRGKRLFARALFGDRELPEEIDEKPPRTPQEVIAAIRAANYPTDRKERLEAVYTLHAVNGKTYGDISRLTGYGKGKISFDLATVERLTGERVRNGGGIIGGGGMAALMEKTRKAHAKAGRKASIYGWHSLRASFVVFAFARGIQEELVAKIVGHSTVDMTRRYFNPDKRNAADLFANYMGGRLISDTPPPAAAVPHQTRPTLTAAEVPALPTDAPQPHGGGNLAALKHQLTTLTPAERHELAALLKA